MCFWVLGEAGECTGSRSWPPSGVQVVGRITQLPVGDGGGTCTATDTCAYTRIRTHMFPVHTYTHPPHTMLHSRKARLRSEHSTYAYRHSTPYAYDPAIERSLN
eukprot:3895052-Rhodomonas_salina.1